MSWVNLNDVYVNKTGGTISGNLAVNGSLTINDGTGNDGTYNVANEITTLRDSVSQIHPVGSVIFLANGKSPSSLGIPGTWVKTNFSIVTDKRFAFDVKDGMTGTSGTNVQIYAYNGTNAQQFWLYTKDYKDVYMWVRTA